MSEQSSLAGVMARQQVLAGRIEVLKETLAFHRQIKPGEDVSSYEDAATAFIGSYVQFGDWLTAMLEEALTESRLVLSELQAETDRINNRRT